MREKVRADSLGPGRKRRWEEGMAWGGQGWGSPELELRRWPFLQERGFACCGQKWDSTPKRYAEPLQALNCIYTEQYKHIEKKTVV